MKIETTEEIDAVNGDLNKAVARNCGRFPLDYMFAIPEQDVARLMFQIGISNTGALGGGSRAIVRHKLIGAARRMRY